MTRPTRIRALARRIGRVRLIAAFVLLVAALLAARFAWHVPLAADAERAMYDTRVVLTAPRVDQDPRVVMVVFNDDTLAKTGRRSPLDRALLARALRRIDALGATGIGIDILVDQPEPEDPQLIAALRAMRTPTFLAFATNATNEGAVLYWQEQFERRIAQALRGTQVRPASILLQPDMDGVIRSWPARPDELPPLLADLMTPGAPHAAVARSIAFRLPAAADRPVFESLPIDLFDSDAGAAALRSQIAGRRVLVGGEITDTDRFDTPLTKL
ncbi:CHASE2 domain-containing protein, partial [uncultured Sphingomonas sp.]|uniref:CHASE2 domain-containing protein n=1 Tax=uncultured Sphingomonas sp. TaxID=158754 RepID=UPI0035C96F20